MIYRYSLAVLSAVLLILSFPGFNIWVIAWVALVPLFFAIEGQKPLKTFLISYIAGFVFFLGTIYWLIHVTLPGMFIVAAYLSLYFGFFGLIINHSLRVPARLSLFLIPAAWVSLEWIRANALTGFGWNLLGYSQSLNLPIIQIADMTGVYGVSFIVVMVNALIYLCVKNRGFDKKFYISLLSAVALFLSVLGYGVYRLNNVFTGERLRVAVVQGNIPQDEKWDDRFVESILSRYEGLTKRAALEGAELLVWPETSIPGFVENDGELSLRIKGLVTAVQTPLLAGAPRYKDTKDGTAYYNSAFLFLKDGEIGGYYDKTHLVPFGEYVPFKKIFSFVHRFAPRPIGECEAGKDLTVFRFPVERTSKDKNYIHRFKKNVAFSCLICFEDIFPGLARQFAKKNSDFLVNITNDAWFARSSAAYQHAQASVFRAVENRINVLRAANTGLSCFIDQKGKVTASVAANGRNLFVEGFEIHEIILSRTRSLYTVYGDLFAYACVLFSILIAVAKKRLIDETSG